MGVVGALTIVELAVLTGAVTVRPAVICDGDRFKIDARDERHIIVWVRHDLPLREARATHDAAMGVLADVLARRRRAELAPVAELAGDERFLDELGDTGTDGVSELVAGQRRTMFDLVEGEG